MQSMIILVSKNGHIKTNIGLIEQIIKPLLPVLCKKLDYSVLIYGFVYAFKE